LGDVVIALKKKRVPLINIMHTEVNLALSCLDILDEYLEGY
jgi:hypothetical protein